MTPNKGKRKLKHRPATVVFQRITPELTLAYRIFSPGLGDEEGLLKLNVQMGRITNNECVGHETVVENGVEVRKEIGMMDDIVKQMNVTERQINEAYDAYKAEIERMMEADQAYLGAKARGEVDEEDNVKRGTKRKSSSSSAASVKSTQSKSTSSPIEASSASLKVSIEMGVDGTANNNNIEGENERDGAEHVDDDAIYISGDDDEDFEDDDSEFDELIDDETKNDFHEVPSDRWMTKTQALTKLATAMRCVDAMRGTLDLIHDFYTTQMIQRHDMTSTFTSALSYMTRLRAYVQDIYEITEGHDSEKCEGGEIHIWEDDPRAVTRLVLRLIPMVDEIPLRVDAVEKLMDEVSAIADELVEAAVEPTRKRFRLKLAQMVKQCHTPVPPHYTSLDGQGTRAPGARRRRQDDNSQKPQESPLD